LVVSGGADVAAIRNAVAIGIQVVIGSRAQVVDVRHAISVSVWDRFAGIADPILIRIVLAGIRSGDAVVARIGQSVEISVVVVVEPWTVVTAIWDAIHIRVLMVREARAHITFVGHAIAVRIGALTRRYTRIWPPVAIDIHGVVAARTDIAAIGYAVEVCVSTVVVSRAGVACVGDAIGIGIRSGAIGIGRGAAKSGEEKNQVGHATSCWG